MSWPALKCSRSIWGWAQMVDPLLNISGLDAYYGDFQALYGVDMTLAPGEVLAVIGANGAGKSSLLRSISGLMLNKAEHIRLSGEAIGRMRPDQVAAKGVALVPEGRQLFPSLSVEENLQIGGRLKSPGRWSLEAVFDLFPILEERRNVASTELSGGQQQMVAIGRALMSNPDLLLFDEISLGLAPVVINNIYANLPKIIDGGVCAIIVEQDVERALAATQRFCCLQEGRITLTGDSATSDLEQISHAYFGVN